MLFDCSGRFRLVTGPLAALTLAIMPTVARAKPSRETILFVRHAEKAPNGLGQLSCKGLNRALALPGVIGGRYGRPDAVFAPNPAQQKPDGGGTFDYVRPLATVEPTAIRFGLPIHADFGYREIDKLRQALLDPTLADATILVGWEHHQLNDLVPAMVKALGGDPTPVSAWPGEDFDTIWKVTILRDEARVTHVEFIREAEGLQGQLDTCPE
jgi:hypothetical protein